MMFFQACQSSLPMWAWLFLPALFCLPEVQGDCTSPVPPLHATLKEDALKESYPVGTKLTYHCITGYEYIPGINSSIICLNTSKWSDISSLCQGKKCMPQIIENGNSDAEDDHNIRLGDSVTLSCEHGYRLVGEAIVKCILKDGRVEWNKEYPICKHIPCNRPENISNGQFDPDPKDEYYVGSVVIYHCKSNFSLIGNSTIRCVTTEDGQNGTWNLPAPECKNVKCDPPKVENGKLINLPKPSYTYNEAISFECNSGYSAVGSLHIKCGANSSWVPGIPKCVKANCTSPVPPLHSALKEEIPKEGYPVGTVLTYHCITGYEYIPGINSSITCLNTSKWSDISSLCQGKKCPAPNVNNSNPVAHDDNDIRLGGNITISCVYGYRLVGEATLKCILKDGKVDWNNEFPICEHISCSRPDNISNGQFDPDPKDEYYVGSVVKYHCKSNFSLIGNSTLICITAKDGRNGTWNLPAPECKTNCTSPVPPLHSTLKEEIPKEGYPVGTVLKYHCITGYEYIPGINSSITCLNTSKWSNISSLCQGKKCPAPNVDNSKPIAHDDNDIRLGGNITISCVYGYRVIGEATLKCILKDGKVDWNREFPYCEHISCSRPTSIPNGQFDLDPNDEYYVGSVVIYRCNRDFSLIGNSTLTCITAEDGLNGKWNLPAPECKNVKCNRPKVENGKLINLPKPSYTYNEAISFECNSGYSAVGSLHIKCGANSSWVPGIPKCVKANCTSPVPPLHSALKEEIPKEGYPVGTVLTYHCITGYEYIPGINSSITCLNTSKWSDISSLCQGKKCPAPNVNNSNPVAHDDNDIRLGGNITISCVYGYRVIGEATLKCILKDGKVDWNREFPHCEHISCTRPTNILNGQIYLNPNDEYYVGSVVIYRCNRDFSLIGNSTLTCITAKDDLNGKWNLPVPECKNVKCDQPKVENGKLINLPKPSYTYNEAISFECNSGYSAVGSLHIKCGANSSWVPAIPKCVKGIFDKPNTATNKPNTTLEDYAECNKTTALGKLIILLAVLYNCW